MRRAVCVTGICVAALMALPLPAASQNKASTAVFLGGDIGPNADALYAGAIVALNGDLTRDGVLLRGLGVYGWYDYSALVGDINGRFSLFDAMIGYQIVRSNLRAAGYVGVELQDHHLSPLDPTNRVSGSEAGFKVAGDITVGYGQPFFVNLIANYSTAFDAYWSRLRIGYNIGQFTIGPEGLLSGNEGSDARRLGAFLGVRLTGTPIEVTISGGRHSNDKGGLFANKDGGYGSLNVGFAF